MKAEPLIVYLPDRRDVEISNRYTKGNNKIGAEVYTYSRVAGRERLIGQPDAYGGLTNLGTCPGSTEECEAICYAKRIKGAVLGVYVTNAETHEVPPIPEDCKILRIHVSGDFDTPEYILNWVKRLWERPDVTCWAYTRSWRCHSLLEFLEQLRSLPNMQLFASIDPTCDELPPIGWRRAWIWRDHPKGKWPMERRLHWWRKIDASSFATPNHFIRGQVSARGPARNAVVLDGFNGQAFACPEETGHKKDCVDCRYCFDGQVNDVVFLEH
jgi:hypothetical protein